MTNLVLIYGTRPEAIKLGPIAAQLRILQTPFSILCTGQHTSLLRGTPAETDLSFGESLNLSSDGGVTRYVRTAQAKIATWLSDNERPTVVIQGDTMTAYAAAQAAAEIGCPLIHVEAGLRSGTIDEPFPEERFRREISQMADLHLAPTSTAYANLVAEGIRPMAIKVTGNPVISAIARYTDITPRPPTPTVVITLHRRELTERSDFKQVIDALLHACVEHPHLTFLWPVHPRVRLWVSEITNVRLVPPLPYLGFLRMVSTAQAVLTDSGGLCEEAAYLGVPTVVFRNVTDRPEAVEAQTARVVPPSPSGAQDAVALCASPWVVRLPSQCFGTPDAALLCAEAITHFVGQT